MEQVGHLHGFTISSATGRAYTMLHQNEWCYSAWSFNPLVHEQVDIIKIENLQEF